MKLLASKKHFFLIFLSLNTWLNLLNHNIKYYLVGKKNTYRKGKERGGIFFNLGFVIQFLIEKGMWVKSPQI